VVGCPLTVNPGSSWELSKKGASDEVVAAPTGHPKSDGRPIPASTRAAPRQEMRHRGAARRGVVTVGSPVN
jgi:hypothetical protein